MQPEIRPPHKLTISFRDHVRPSDLPPVNSLQPNALSLRPRAGEPAPPSRIPSRGGRRLVAACIAACVAAVCVVGWRAHTRSQPRIERQVVSGRAGLRTTQSGLDERWSATSVTLTIDPSLASLGPGAKDAVVQAFGAWASSGAEIPPIAFDTSSTAGSAAQDGVNRILVAPITIEGHEADLAITVSYVNAATGQILEADTIFNSGYVFATIERSAGAGEGKGREDDDGDICGHRYDLQNVATHEAGHFFGLGEDYADQATTMYVSSSPCQTSKRVLTTSDVSVMSTLYQGAAAAAAANTQGCSVQAARTDVPGVGSLAVLAAATLVAARGRRRG